MVLTESGYERSRKAKFVPLLKRTHSPSFILSQMELRKESGYEKNCEHIFQQKIKILFIKEISVLVVLL